MAELPSLATIVDRYPMDLLPNDSERWVMFQVVDPSTGEVDANTNRKMGTAIRSIVTYLPPSALKTHYRVVYQPEELGAFWGKIFAPTAAIPEDSENPRTSLAGSVSDFFQNLLDLAKADIQKMIDKSPIGSAISARRRKTVNQRVQNLFKNVDFRTHQFDLHMAARNEAEAQTIQNIIHTFKLGMLPSYESAVGTVPGGVADTQLFFGFPYEWRIFFSPIHQGTTFQILQSVLTDLVVDYAPSGQSAFHHDGQPVSVTVSLTFLEMELLTREKYAKQISAEQDGNYLVDVATTPAGGHTYLF